MDIRSMLTKTTSVHLQTGGTCYAHAISSFIRYFLVEPPSHSSLVKAIVQVYGENGADTFKVLSKVGKKYNVLCERIQFKEAEDIIDMKKPLIALLYFSQ